jgi:MFS superfamily sulfate permease-like transporter
MLDVIASDLFCVILFYFSKGVLAAIVIASLKGMFLQFHDLEAAFWVNRTDCMIWLATFAIVVLFDVQYGLLAGLAMALLAILWASYFGEGHVLGRIGETDLFANPQKFSAVSTKREREREDSAK